MNYINYFFILLIGASGLIGFFLLRRLRDLDSLFNLTPDIACITNEDGVFIKVNPAFCSTLGYSEKELLNKPYIDFVHPEDRKKTKKTDSEMIPESKTKLVFNNRFIHKNGSVIWISWASHSKNKRIYATGRNITEIKIGTDIFQERFDVTNATLRGIVNTIPQQVWTSSACGSLEYCNDRLVQYTGAPLEAHLGSGWLNSVHPDDRQLSIEKMTASVVTGAPFEIEHRLRDKNGNYRWHLARATAVRNENGNIIKWIGTETDIDIQKNESENLLNSFFMTSPDLLCIANTDGFLVKVNPSFVRVLGYTEEELLAKTFIEFIHPEDRNKTVNETQKIATEFESTPLFTNRYVKKDGNIIWISWTAMPVPGGLIYATGRDITEIKLRNDAFKEKFDDTHMTFHGIMNVVPEMVWTALPEGKSDYFNNRVTEYTGLSPEALLGMGWFNYIHPDDREDTGLKWSRSISTGEPFEIEYRILNKEGEYRWHLTRAVLIRKDDGCPYKWVGVCTDIEEQKRAQKVILQSQVRLREILSKLPIICWSTDEEGIVTFFQGTALKLLGMKDDELMGTNVFHNSCYTEEARNAYKDAMAGKITNAIYKKQHRTFHSHYTRLKNGLVAVSIDITDQHELQEKNMQLRINERAALETARLKSEFLANMSHEIRTPINGILGLHEMIKDSGLNDEQKIYLNTAEGCAKSLMRIINDILDISKVEAGKIDIEEVDFNLNDILAELNMLLIPQAAKKNLSLKFSICDEVPAKVKGDPVRVKQILMNLLNNSIKFTETGSVLLSCYKLSDQSDYTDVGFNVTDTGIGMPENVQKKIFAPFTQADSSTTRRYGGTGLGLYISRSLVQRMGGELKMLSEEGTGTSFWFTLPFKRQTPQPTVLSSIHTNPTPLKKLRVLVAEDNAVNQLIAKKQLQKMGHEPVIVSNGKEAILKLDEEVFDVILMDCQMPEMDGFTATEHIRKRTDSKNTIPIIAMTANALSGDREKCLVAGMTEYISKPMTTDDLAKIINEVVNS